MWNHASLAELCAQPEGTILLSLGRQGDNEQIAKSRQIYLFLSTHNCHSRSVGKFPNHLFSLDKVAAEKRVHSC